MRLTSDDLSSRDIEAVERATLCAMPPEACEEFGGWLLAFDPGTVGRAHSAVPLRHKPPSPGTVDTIAQRYATRERRPVLRLPRVSAFERCHRDLIARGWSADKPTLVQVAAVSSVAAVPLTAAVELDSTVGAEWRELFLGEGVNPADGASRLGILRRAQASMFASVVLDGRVAAVGSASFSHGWASVHGMRTLPAYRGKGLAGSILSRFAKEAVSRGMARIFLQVEEGNLTAQSLYRRAGFASAWVYDYWKPA